MAETVLESLKGVNAYPVPLRTLSEIAKRRGISLTDETTQESLKGMAYNLARADLLLWLSLAPNISQGGQSYSFTDEQRRDFSRQAYAIYGRLEPEAAEGNVVKYGYKGSKL